MNSASEIKRISFDIHGEFITQIAREWFYTGEKSIEKVMELLINSMAGTNTPEVQIRRYAEDILIGRAALKGSTEEDTYHLEIYEPGEEERMPENMNIWKEVDRRKKAEESLKKMVERWDIVMEYISESEKREIRKVLGEETEEDRQQEGIDRFIKRMKDSDEHSTKDYGWLEPNGTFHEVEWGGHQDWANKYLEEHLTSEEQFAAMVEINASGMSKSCSDVIGAGDYLVRRGWILLHNPSQGIAIPTRDTVRQYTKAQKEFLYSYYMERDCRKEANAIWKE